MDRCRRLAVSLSIVLVSACAPSMLGIAQAQDRGSWSVASTMPSGTGDYGVVALDGKIYVVGGSTFRAHILPTSSDMGSGTWGSTVNYEYDPKTDRWSERPRFQSD
jgi:kelch motif-containing protein